MKIARVVTIIVAVTLITAISPVAQNWQTVYETDFSTDPGWTTNSPGDLYWDAVNGDYHVNEININYGGNYGCVIASYDGGSFLLEWDVMITHREYASGLVFGIFDSDFNTNNSESYAIVVLVGNDQGNVTGLEWCGLPPGNPGSVYEDNYQWPLDTWYRVSMEYNSGELTLSAEVSLVSTGQAVFSLSATGVGPFDSDMTFIGNSNVRDGSYQVPGAHFEGEFDNVTFSLPVHAQSDCPPLYSYEGAADGEYGAAVSGAGDFNGDGFDDFLVGAPGVPSEAYVYSGVDGSLLCVLQGEGSNDNFGVRISGAGDINDDGYGDVIVGAFRNDVAGSDAGRAYVFLGGGGAYPQTINAANADMVLTGEAAHDLFGVGVAGAGDVNGDGFDDVVVGAYESNAGATKAGRAYVFLGSSGPYPQNIAASAAHFIVTGDDAEARFGASVAGVGDIDLDGYDDFVVGEEGDDAGGTNAGAASVISGQTGALLYKFNGEFPNDRHGIGVSGAGDVNGDGWPDVVVGSDLYGGWTGKAYVYSGQDGTLLIDITGEAGGDRFGHFVSNAGDMNGDGFDDVLISAYINDAGGHYAGRAYVILGDAGPYPRSLNASAADLIFTGEAANDRFGWSIACAGNVNNDGTDEIIIGAVDEDQVGSSVYVYDCVSSGGPTPIAGIVSADGAALRGVTVDLSNDMGALVASEVTDTDGFYEFTEVANGDYTVEIQTPLGFVPISDPIVAVAIDGMSAEVNFELELMPEGSSFTWSHWWWKIAVDKIGQGIEPPWGSKAEIENALSAAFDHFYGRNDGYGIQIPEVTCMGDPARAMSFDDLHGILFPAVYDGSYPAMARRSLLTLVLNLASAHMSQTHVVSEDGATASQALTYFAGLYLSGDDAAVYKTYYYAKKIWKGQLVPAGVVPLTTPDIMYKLDAVDGLMPIKYQLSQNYPNPFNPATEISYSIKQAGEVRIDVFNTLGQKVATVYEGFSEAGEHSVNWDASAQASGVYLYRLTAGEFVETKKMMLLK